MGDTASEAERDKALVLVVDDERDIRNLVMLRLDQAGYETTEAADGTQALRLVQELRPDLIVLDVRMPDLDGYQICERIRADEEMRETPILLLSASVHEHEVQHGLDAGANDYLRKPFRASELQERVAALLGRTPQAL